VRADDPPIDEPRPTGFPPGFGDGPGEADPLLVLRCLLGITPRTLHELIWQEGSAVAALAAVARGAAGSDNDRAFATGTTATEIRERVRAAGARFAWPGDPEYWPALLRLEDPPVGVFLRGRPLSLEHRRVAIVGSRRPSATGVEVARTLAHGSAVAGLVVTSGGALGIDARAHEGALDAGGSTVAVLGSGIDQEYPATNRRLLREIVDRGTLVSEYPPGVPAEPFRFPARNRLIAGLSIGVVIVEGVARSGTRSTADFASQVGIDVFGVPGAVTSQLSEAPNALIRDGARLIRGIDDLLHDLGVEPAPSARTPEGLPADQRAALEVLEQPMLPEVVARETGLSVPDTLSALVHLELRGLVLGSGGRYRRAFGSGTPDGRDAAASATVPDGGGRHPSG
jgi:DNA processing protein